MSQQIKMPEITECTSFDGVDITTCRFDANTYGWIPTIVQYTFSALFKQLD